jgi:HK97 family phage portal protein
VELDGAADATRGTAEVNPLSKLIEKRAVARPFNVAGQMLQPPAPSNNFWTWWSGSNATTVTYQTAGSLPAVTAAVRLIAETVAAMPLYVFEGLQADKRRMDGSRQFELLNNRPNPEQSAFDFIQDIAACVEWTGNAFISKVKVDGVIQELWPLDPSIVAVLRDDNGDKVFQIVRANGQIVRLDSSDIIHIRGFSHTGGLVGMSPISEYRESLGANLSMQEFVGNFYRNNAQPGVVLVYPQDITEQQATDAAKLWNASHGGPRNAARTAVLGAGADVKTLPISFDDQQFVQSREFGIKEVARMFRVPASLLGGGEAVLRITTEQEALNFLEFSLLPRMRRIERAFRHDLDLFGDTPMYPEFHVDEFLRADAATRAAVDHQLVQSGILLVDEARANRGLPPLPNGAGQIPQLVPVGGSPAGLQALLTGQAANAATENPQ